MYFLKMYDKLSVRFVYDPLKYQTKFKRLKSNLHYCLQRKTIIRKLAEYDYTKKSSCFAIDHFSGFVVFNVLSGPGRFYINEVS